MDSPVLSSNTEETLPKPVASSVFPDIDVEEQRKRHIARANRFGIEVIEPKVDVVQPITVKRYRSKRKVNVLSEEEKLKREQRAARFGITPTSEIKDEDLPTSMETEETAERMDLDMREEKRDPAPTVQRRVDTVHLYGTDEMSTDDIFDYFKTFAPTFVEWINDSSCNVVFDNTETAQKALEANSTPIENSVNSITTTEATPSDDVDLNVYRWHKGVNSKSTSLMMRFASVEDVRTEKKPSAYYQKIFKEREAKQQADEEELEANEKRRLQITVITSKNKNKNKNKNKKRKDRKDRKRKQEGDVKMQESEPLDPEEAERRKKKNVEILPWTSTTNRTTSSTRSTTNNTNSSFFK